MPSASGASCGRRIGHIWPKRNEIKVVNKAGLLTDQEVALQTRVIANRPVAGIIHLVIFYGFVLRREERGPRAHRCTGDEGAHLPGPHDPFLDVISVLVLVACILMVVRRYFMKERLTHPVESGLVLSLIGLMITYMLSAPPSA